MSTHEFERVREESPGGRMQLVCSCGWASSWAETAEVVGDEWDRHLLHEAGSPRSGG